MPVNATTTLIAIGSSNAPPGMRSPTPRKPPNSAMPSAPRTPCVDQACAAIAACAAGVPNSLATSAATSRAASDPRILHEGDEAEVGAVGFRPSASSPSPPPATIPRSRSVPGRTRERVSSEPSSEAAAIVDETPIRKIGQPAPILGENRSRQVAGDHDADNALGEEERRAGVREPRRRWRPAARRRPSGPATERPEAAAPRAPRRI